MYFFECIFSAIAGRNDLDSQSRCAVYWRTLKIDSLEMVCTDKRNIRLSYRIWSDPKVGLAGNKSELMSFREVS
jgi:hypothetical protein